MLTFKNIKQIPRGRYEVNISIKYLESAIKGYEEDYGLEVPWFQRGHVWTAKQQVEYVEFFLRGGTTGRVIQFNYPGWAGGTVEGNMVIVDGLQRLTAIRGFLAGTVLPFGQRVEEFGSLLTCPNNLLFNINNISCEKELVEWYLGMNTGGTAHTDEEINRVKEQLEKMNNA